MEKGYRSKGAKGQGESLEEGLEAPWTDIFKAPFLERRHLCRHGFCYSMIKDPSTKAANGKGVSLEEGL